MKELVLREDEQEYAQVVKLLGNRRMECLCFDGQTRIGTVRGKMRKRQWVRVDDIVLTSLREFQDAKVDIIEVYNSTQVRQLIKLGEIPELQRVAAPMESSDEEEDLGVTFDDTINIDKI